MTLILSIDTSSQAVVVGLDNGLERSVGVSRGAVAAGSGPVLPPSHGEDLAPAVARALSDLAAEPRDLTHIVVGVGPGPFTGLRVGIVTARVMADALGIPVLGVCSLDAIARHARLTELVGEPFTVVTDARRREVYARRYAADGMPVGDPWVSRADDLPADVRGGPVVGPGAALFPDAFADVRGTARIDSGGLESVARDAALGRPSTEVRDTTPLYLRRPDAVESHARKRVTQP
jgi:tRNA threonylcarbamoyl adenosine modification protein YeaZ